MSSFICNWRTLAVTDITLNESEIKTAASWLTTWLQINVSWRAAVWCVQLQCLEERQWCLRTWKHLCWFLYPESMQKSHIRLKMNVHCTVYTVAAKQLNITSNSQSYKSLSPVSREQIYSNDNYKSCASGVCPSWYYCPHCNYVIFWHKSLYC